MKNLLEDYPSLTLQDLCDIPMDVKKDNIFKDTRSAKICE